MNEMNESPKRMVHEGMHKQGEESVDAEKEKEEKVEINSLMDCFFDECEFETVSERVLLVESHQTLVVLFLRYLVDRLIVFVG